MTYDQWKTESGYDERPEARNNGQEELRPWMKNFDANEQSALMYKVLDYIDSGNAFGDHFSEYDRLRIITLLGERRG